MPRISKMVATANRLREVRKACRQFVALWAYEQGNSSIAAALPPEVADPNNHNWTLLYRGSVLDD